MKKDIKKMIKVAENLGWTVSRDCGQFIFKQYSPAGQDFDMTIEITNNLDEVVEKIQERCENFDCAEETYLWLDDTGHGKKGAPDNMKDIYEDMEACLKMMTKLCDELEKLL